MTTFISHNEVLWRPLFERKVDHDTSASETNPHANFQSFESNTIEVMRTHSFLIIYEMMDVDEGSRIPLRGQWNWEFADPCYEPTTVHESDLNQEVVLNLK